uniref:Uncharacterized protein n=1 Tax=Arundo donax TaxID=35708 RepID=A0A0A8YYX5_ARUDO
MITQEPQFSFQRGYPCTPFQDIRRIMIRKSQLCKFLPTVSQTMHKFSVQMMY